MIAFECSSCGKSLKVKDELAGKKVKCPGCGKPVAVPHPAASVSPAPADDRTLPPKARPPTDERTLPPKGNKESLSEADAHTNLGAGKAEVTQAPREKPNSELTDFLAPPEQPDELGRLGGFRILKVLGQGGMGVVFLGEDPKLGRKVAIKAMLPDLAESKSAQQRFLREARAAAALEHDHIVAIHQVSEDRGAPFIVMPFLQGEPLDERLKRDKTLPVASVLRIGRETAEGLSAAHKKGMIHRDIKPANIWLEGDKQRVKILDFGLARAAAGESGLTQTGAIVGTPQYMAPEQAEGKKDIDHRCDLFSLGCVLYRMCTGEMPFKGDSTLAVISALAMHNPKAPSKINKSVPQPLSKLIMHLLAKSPDDRPQSAQEASDALAQLSAKDTAQMPAKAGKTTLFQRPQSNTSRGKLALVGGVVLGLAVLGLVVFFLASRERQRPEEPLPKTFTNSLGMEFVLVPKGKSWLGGGGGSPGYMEVEILEDFYLGKYEVTQEEWEKVTGSNPSAFKDRHVPGVSPQDRRRFPVEMVSWNDCQGFIERLNQRVKDSGWVYRLPKKDEWEYACRGGPLADRSESTFDFYLEKPSSKLLPEQANFARKSSLERPCKVGSYKENRLGLFDMHGNVMEWCEDHDDPSEEPRLRGGGYADAADACRVAFRHSGSQTMRHPTVGLRLARVPANKEIVATPPAPQKKTEEADPDRKAAELVLSLKGPCFCKIFYGGKLEEIRSGGLVTRLPSEPFALHEIYLHLEVGTDEVASRLTGLKSLRLLTFYGCPLTDDGVRSLRDLPELFYLNLHGTKITNTGLPSLRALPKLRQLSLIETGITDEGLLGLQQLPLLESVVLWRTVITDKGLQNLRANKRLANVSVKETKVTAAGVKAFAEARPDCRIEWDGGVIPGKESTSLFLTFKNSLGMEFVLVPKGKSWLGGSGGKPGDKEVEIKEDFYLGKYEVTQEEWEKVVGSNPSQFKAVPGISKADQQRFPVEMVSWDDCQAFIARLNKQVKDVGWVYRLPKEAEWEYACRGGPMADKSESTFDFYFDKPTNTQLPDQANFNDANGLKRTCKVGSYEPNKLGLYDMHGNVWEWCADAERKPDGTLCRLNRGGGYDVSSRGWETASRNLSLPGVHATSIGLRLARVPVGKEIIKVIAPEEKKPPVGGKSPSDFGSSGFLVGENWAMTAPPLEFSASLRSSSEGAGKGKQGRGDVGLQKSSL